MLDSCACEHVADNAEALGYKVTSSAANGEAIGNKSQIALNLLTTDVHPITSTFQVYEVSRPLWLVSKICDAGCRIVYDNKGATVQHVSTGKDLCKFGRQRGL